MPQKGLSLTASGWLDWKNLLPHIRAINEGLSAIDEERRLCYVGVTRARKRLVLSLALTRMKWGKAKPCKPSRFLYELTGQSEKFTEGPARHERRLGQNHEHVGHQVEDRQQRLTPRAPSTKDA